MGEKQAKDEEKQRLKKEKQKKKEEKEANKKASKTDQPDSIPVQPSPEEPVDHKDDPEQRKALELEMSQYHIREEIHEEGSKNDTRLSAIREETEEVTSFSALKVPTEPEDLDGAPAQKPAETDVPLKTSEDYSKEESVTTATENKTTTAKTTAQTPTMATTAGGERSDDPFDDFAQFSKPGDEVPASSGTNGYHHQEDEEEEEEDLDHIQQVYDDEEEIDYEPQNGYHDDGYGGEETPDEELEVISS